MTGKKITIETTYPDGTTRQVSVFTSNAHANASTVVELIQDALKADGYNDETVKEMFNEE